ncbi:MAG: outer membrane protein transport protein [Deltaproteobacteria bacterium]|nr:outer membrane protein transport protein [Deltaproteobacteria bacterium]
MTRPTGGTGVAVALLLFLAAGPARGGGYYNPDFGTKRGGMMAVIANPDDPTAIFHNPAAMTGLVGTHLYHSQTWFLADARMQFYDSQGVLRPDHAIGPDWNLGFSPFIGVVTDFGGLQRLRMGVAVYAPNAFGAVLPDDEPTRYHVLKAFFIAPRLTTSFAWAFTPRFSAALSFNLLTSGLYAERMMNPLVLQDPDLRFADPETLAPYDAKLKLSGMAVTWAWDTALWFRPLETFRIGVMFAAGAPSRLKGRARLRYADGTRESTRQRTMIAIPFTLQAGTSWEFARDFEWNVDVRYWHYQVNQEQLTRLSQPIMGIEEFREPKNYRNAYSVGTGLLYRVIPPVDVMAGFQWDTTGFREYTLSVENPNRDRLGVSMGVRWRINGHVRVGLSFVRQWFQMYDIQNSITTPPTNAKGYGAISQFGADVDWSL